jgi:hypothetical protein
MTADVSMIIRRASRCRRSRGSRRRCVCRARPGCVAARDVVELIGQTTTAAHPYLGSAQFVERVQALIDRRRPLQEIPKRQRRALAKPLHYSASRYPDWGRALAAAYRTGACSIQAIAERFGVSRMTVSRTVKCKEQDSTPADETASV